MPLLPFDAALVARDPALPGLALLLEPAALFSTLRPLVSDAGAGWGEAARIAYIRYKPGTNCLVAYQIEVDTPTTVYATAHARSAEDKWRKARKDELASGQPSRLVLDEHAIAVSFFPHDRRLPALARLWNDQKRRKLLQELLPNHRGLWDVAPDILHMLAYKPERRCVLRLGNADESVVLRFYSQSEFASARGKVCRFASRESLRVACVLGISEQHAALATEWLSGRALSVQMQDAASPHSLELMARTGAALAELHAQPGDGLPPLTHSMEIRALKAATSAMDVVCPHLKARAEHAARQLGVLLEPAVAPCSIHGDFYAQQVLLMDKTVGLLDLDEAAYGDSEFDLGNFIAHLEREALRADLPAANVNAWRGALLDGYRRAGGELRPDQVEVQTAAGLLRLALAPFRAHEPEWPEHIAAIVERVEALLSAISRRSAEPQKEKERPTGTSQKDEHTAKTQKRPPHFASSDLDSALPFLTDALDPVTAGCHIIPVVLGATILHDARLMRHKVGRRALVQYDLETGTGATLSLIAKIRAKGLDEATYALCRTLQSAGFSEGSADGVSVPAPAGKVPEWRMWLAHKVPGVMATQLLPEAGGTALAVRLAEAICKLHRAGIAPRRRHTMDDELAILHARLPLVAQAAPQWIERLARVLAACDRLGASVPAPRTCGIHRDFYPDQVLVNDPRLWLLDLDLYCEGDPALDAGNFLAHLAESSLRASGDSNALSDREAAFEDAFLRRSPGITRATVQAYRTLTLVRHIHISTQIAGRGDWTPAFLELSEEHLGLSTRPSFSVTFIAPGQQPQSL